MAYSERLIVTLKRELKTHGLTYADVAVELGLSQASIKHMFSTHSFSLKRLDTICEMMGLDMHDLVKATEAARARINRLTLLQEQELVSDIQLLLVAVCVKNAWTFEDIVSQYDIDEKQCIRLLARLDRLRLIELLPGNRIRLIVAHDFRWLPGGPIETFFQSHILPEFLEAGFQNEGELRVFLSGMLSKTSREILLKRLQALNMEMAELQQQDADVPVAQRSNTGIFLAMRSWELAAFQVMRRKS